MNNQIENDVIQFIIEELNVGKDEVSLDSSLLKDFGIDGDDGYEFIDKFNDKFKINPPIDPEKYFNPEHFSLKAIFKQNKPFKVSDLVNIAKDKGVR